MRDPVITHRSGDIQTAGEVSARHTLMENGSDIVDFEVRPREPID
jgi:hypothetical protein